MNDAIIYPGMEAVSSLIYNGIYQDGNTHSSFLAQTLTRTEGWYLGLKAEYTDSAATQTKSELVANVGDQNVGTYTFSTDGTDQYAVAQPLYFQQNTWLKTALEPFDEGWHARMGFIYDTLIIIRTSEAAAVMKAFFRTTTKKAITTAAIQTRLSRVETLSGTCFRCRPIRWKGMRRYIATLTVPTLTKATG